MFNSTLMQPFTTQLFAIPKAAKGQATKARTGSTDRQGGGGGGAPGGTEEERKGRKKAESQTQGSKGGARDLGRYS